MKLPRKEHAKAVNTNGSFRRVPVWRQKHASFILMKLLSIE
jgi:hypothetical protein